MKITQLAHVFQSNASSYNVEFLNSFNPELQLKDTRFAIKNKLKQLLTELRGFKFMATLVLMLKKIESEDKTKYDTFYSHSKAETVGESDDVFESFYTTVKQTYKNLYIDDVFQSIYTTVISNIKKSLGKGSNWITDSVIEHNLNISKCNPSAGGSCKKLPKELDHPLKGLINNQSIDDNECFKWCLVRYIQQTIIQEAGKES